MKTLKKMLSVVLVTAMMITVFAGCGAKVSPAESTKIYLDVVFKGDKKDISKIGMTEEDFNKVRTELEDSMMKQMAGASFNLSEEEKNTFKDKILEGYSKIEYTVGEGKEEGDTATVELKMKGFDLNKIMEKVQTQVKEEVAKNPSLATSQKDAVSLSFKITGDAFAEGILVDEAKTVSLKLNKNKDKNTWEVDSSAFGDLLSALIRM